MKKLLLLFMAGTFAIGNVNSQVKRTPTKRTTNSITAKKKAEAKTKAKAEAEAAEKARIENNSKCSFSFYSGNFVSQQGNGDFVTYEIPEMTASELKSSVYTTLTSIFKSPKDAITSITDNMIQLEGYSPNLFKEYLGDDYGTVSNHIIFSLVIQFKDGKVRYNAPSIKNIHMKVDNSDIESIPNVNGINLRSYFTTDVDGKLESIEMYFNNLISLINNKLKKSNDW